MSFSLFSDLKCLLTFRKNICYNIFLSFYHGHLWELFVIVIVFWADIMSHCCFHGKYVIQAIVLNGQPVGYLTILCSHRWVYDDEYELESLNKLCWQMSWDSVNHSSVYTCMQIETVKHALYTSMYYELLWLVVKLVVCSSEKCHDIILVFILFCKLLSFLQAQHPCSLLCCMNNRQ